MTTPLVSICSITYNHAPFIRQCLDGFLMQQCNFPIEIIINDDCSTDGTTEIIREYAEKYPDEIFPIFHEENLYSQGVRGMFQKFVFPKARGKYIALCEGDDYWTDPLKLQKQVDFLEAHPDYSMCWHRVDVWNVKESVKETIYDHLEEREYTADEIIRKWSIPTCSVLYRKEIINKIPFNPLFQYGDNVVFLTCSKYGRICCLADCMGVYNVHPGGFLSSKSKVAFALEQFNHHRGLKQEFCGNVELTNAINEQIYKYALILLSEFKKQSFYRFIIVLLIAIGNGPIGFYRYYIAARRRWSRG